MTDAIGFMATGDFVSFMSGNTTRLAVAISEGDFGLMLRLLVVVATFIGGNTLGIVVSRMTGRRALPLLLCIAALLSAAAALPLTAQLPALLAAIIAMGMLNAAVEEVNGFPIGLTYVTGALSRFGRGLGRWMLGERRNGWRVQLIPWTGMFAGAVIGALLEQQLGMKALLFSGLLSAVLGFAALKIPRRWQLAYMPK
jgi:uncharacterized membrane protein YoaK (UPF0700 family)